MEYYKLMIVVAIIGILAAIASPQYQNYIAKSQVSRVMGEVSSLKTTVETCMLEGKVTAATCELGWTESNLIAKASGSFGADPEPVADPEPGADAAAALQSGLSITWPTEAAPNVVTIAATFGQSAATAIATDTLTWARDADGAWSCSTTVEEKFAPAGCPVKAPTKAPTE